MDFKRQHRQLKQREERAQLRMSQSDIQHRQQRLLLQLRMLLLVSLLILLSLLYVSSVGQPVRLY